MSPRRTPVAGIGVSFHGVAVDQWYLLLTRDLLSAYAGGFPAVLWHNCMDWFCNHHFYACGWLVPLVVPRKVSYVFLVLFTLLKMSQFVNA